MSTIGDNLKHVEENIQKACDRSGRRRDMKERLLVERQLLDLYMSGCRRGNTHGRKQASQLHRDKPFRRRLGLRKVSLKRKSCRVEINFVSPLYSCASSRRWHWR